MGHKLIPVLFYGLNIKSIKFEAYKDKNIHMGLTLCWTKLTLPIFFSGQVLTCVNHVFLQKICMLTMYILYYLRPFMLKIPN